MALLGFGDSHLLDLQEASFWVSSMSSSRVRVHG